MSHDRNMKYLIDNRIIYRRLPIKDKPSEVYDWGWFYKEGTHEYYNLFNSPAKITTYKSLKWHLIVLYYLNQDIGYEQFKNLDSFSCTCPKCGKEIEIFSDEFDKKHRCKECHQEIDFTQCKLQASGKMQ